MTSEAFKGGVHWVLGGLALTCGLYNALRFSETRSLRHGVNAAVYGCLWCFEWRNYREHQDA